MIKRYKIEIDTLNEADYIKEYNLLRGISAKKIDQLRNEDDRRRSLAGLILLRRGIRQLFGTVEYQISYNPNGRPELPFCRFSIAHSAEMAVCAFSDRPIGIDVEKLRPVPVRKKYPLFSPDETAYINDVSGSGESRFLEIWTKKEAYIKMLGGRLTDAAGIEVISEPTGCCILSVIEDGYIISVCEKNS